MRIISENKHTQSFFIVITNFSSFRKLYISHINTFTDLLTHLVDFYARMYRFITINHYRLITRQLRIISQKETRYNHMVIIIITIAQWIYSHTRVVHRIRYTQDTLYTARRLYSMTTNSS